MEKRSTSRPKERKTWLQKSFGTGLRKRRLELGLSQEKLAGLADLHFTYESSVERRKKHFP